MADDGENVSNDHLQMWLWSFFVFRICSPKYLYYTFAGRLLASSTYLANILMFMYLFLVQCIRWLVLFEPHNLKFLTDKVHHGFWIDSVYFGLCIAYSHQTQFLLIKWVPAYSPCEFMLVQWHKNSVQNFLTNIYSS